MEKLENLLTKNEESITLSQPQPAGCFSLNIDREYLDDISGLRYFIYPSNSNLDLNKGFSTFIKKPESAKREKINHMLQFVLHNYPLVKGSGNDLLDAEFLCFRGLLSLIMKTPYERDNWTICATKWRGTIYLCEFDKTEHSYNKSDLYNYWGHKFENYTLFDSPDEKNENNEPVNECEEFCVLFRSELNDLKLLYGAEMDGVISDESFTDKDFLDKANFVELKTNKLIENRRQELSFRKHKLLKFWCQSYLVGIKRIMVGYRTEKGILSKVLPLSVVDIPKRCNGLWDPQQCFKFLYEFLLLIKTVLVDIDDYNIIWKFSYDAKTKTINYEKTDDSEYSFLPTWYTEQVLKLHQGF